MKHLSPVSKTKPVTALAHQTFVMTLLEKQLGQLVAALPAKKAEKAAG
ncbi:MAG: hypothetical protein JXR94_18170 [Candidatus Hydrogenedentes bacterium]|nr:hypothetical protein [Candidatus Hydrogenedentota bacterium]